MRKNLSVPYAEKELAKKEGALWDSIERTWYVSRPHQKSNELLHEDRVKFGRWLKQVPANKLVTFKPTKWCPAYK